MKIVSTYFEPKEGGSRWRELLLFWIHKSLKWGHDVDIVTDEPGEWVKEIEPIVGVHVIPKLCPPEPDVSNVNARMRHAFNRKGDLICRARYEDPFIGKDILFLDLDAIPCRDPFIALWEEKAFEGPWFAMARDANIRSVTQAKGWKSGHWSCGGIIFVRATCPPDWLRDNWIRAMQKTEEAEPGHYLQEQIAWSSLLNQVEQIGLAARLSQNFNTVPHLSHMIGPDPVIEHHHGPHKWKLLDWLPNR